MSQRTKGQTSVSLLFRLTDATTGKAVAGLDVTALKLQVERPGAAAGAATALTALATLATAWTAFGAKEVDGTNSKGVYRVDAPDAACAAGADEVTLSVSGAAIETATRLLDLLTVDLRAAGGTVAVGSNLDKTGYALATAPPTVVQVRQELDANSTRLANLDAAVSTRSTFAGGPVASVAAGVTLAAAGLDAVAVEAGVNARQALALIGSAVAAKATGLDTATATFYALGSASAVRIVAAGLDATGNRPSVPTLTPPA